MKKVKQDCKVTANVFVIGLHAFFISNTFISNATLKLNFWYLKIIILHPKIIQHILKNKQRNKCVCIHEIMRFIIMKIRWKWKKDHIDTTYRPRSRHRHKYNKCKKCLSMILLTCIKQHLSNIWRPIYRKVKQQWGLVGKKGLFMKKTYILTSPFSSSAESTFTWDPKWTQTGLKSQTALKSRFAYMAIYIAISLRHLSKQ